MEEDALSATKRVSSRLSFDDDAKASVVLMFWIFFGLRQKPTMSDYHVNGAQSAKGQERAESLKVDDYLRNLRLYWRRCACKHHLGVQ